MRRRGRDLALAVVLALGSFLGLPVAHALPAESWLVAIGSNLGDPDELALRFAERDAQQFADVLRQQAGVASRRTLMLLGEDADTVRRALQDLNAEIREHLAAGQPSALVVFYSGHADTAAVHLKGSTLPLDELRKLVQGSPAAVRLLIVDACRSGTITRVKGVQAAPTFALQLEDPAVAEGMAILTSSAAGESSQESDRLRGSFFSHHLVNALRGAADRNGDGRVTLSEAYAYTYDQTLRSSGRTMELQHPTYAFDVKGREDLVISAAGIPQGQTGRLRLGDASLYLVTEEREGGPIVAEVAPAHPQAQLLLPVGHYFVQQRLRAEYREYQVKLAAAADVVLSQLPYRSVQYDRLVRRRGGTSSRAHGMTALFGVHGPLVAGEGAAPQVQLGYNVDLPWLSVGPRLRGALASGTAVDGLVTRDHYELGLGLLVQRFIDLRYLSFAFGLYAEGVYHRQELHSDRMLPARGAWGFGFGGLLSLEVPLGRGLSLRAEAGPLTELFGQAVVDNGAQVGQSVESPLTYWAAGGLVWRM